MNFMAKFAFSAAGISDKHKEKSPDGGGGNQQVSFRDKVLGSKQPPPPR